MILMNNTIFNMALAPWPYVIYLFTFPALLMASGQTDNLQETEDTIQAPWSYSAFLSQQINQASFSNWVQGGENMFASTSIVQMTANFQNDIFSWENRLNMAFGLIKSEDTPMRKNEDRIHLLSKAGREISPHLNTSFLGEFRSQFYKGYNYPNDSVVVSRFMAPGHLSLSLGIDYKPWEFLSLFISPASGKFTFVRDQELANKGAFGVRPAEYDQDGNLIREGSNLNAEFGALINIMFSKVLMGDVEVDSRLSLFNNLFDDDRSNRKNTDVDWETSVNIKINRYITASFLIHMLYDHDTPIPVMDEEGNPTGEFTRKLQIKQMFGLGLSYRL